ncbi:SAM dependent carboxyl methyltransferase [Musa troglodytarum]|uniref:SAM dependent carboxyl methyltransferase n=1 Tax=Musa troglodytarum TaxID=320322 RepID=A0A9E7HCR9_9LILI|nr:SAM dependent carboxyl methyltransferase [Musa troglodytarum]
MASCQPPSTTELVTMDVESVLHMKGGLGETSYAQNSSLQKKSMEAIKHIIVDSATDVYASRAPGCFTIADLGCSSGTNAFSLVSKIVESIHEKARQSERLMPEILVFLNDLPTNDFNSVFLNFPEFTRKLKGGIELQEGSAPSVYLAALPGSFYGRLFPSNSLDFIYSCHSLHWLSEVPLGLVDGNGKPINKGKIYISNTSHPAVPLAYLRQFQKDFSLFLKSRSAELRSGGRIVVLILGRRTDDHSDKSATVLWELLDQSLAIMVSQEMVDEEKVDTYNVPFYAPSTKEIEDEVGREGSFEIDFIQAYELNTSTGDPHKDARITSMAIRAIQESMITHHFGEGIADTLFQIYSGLLNPIRFFSGTTDSVSVPKEQSSRFPSKIFSFLSSTTKSSMASSPSRTSSGSSQLQNSGSEEDLKAVMDQKKLKRMISNRESARRSRMRKRKHLDELMAQLNQLRKENRQLSTAFSLTKQRYVAVEAENCVLRAQMMELDNSLQSLGEILSFLNMNINVSGHQMIDNSIKCLNQRIMASADMFYY